MNNQLGFLKTTVVGGFIFLIPAAIVVVVLGKVIGALKALAKALAPVFGIESFAGGVVLDLLVLAVILLLCFVAGLLARRASAKHMRAKLDRTLLNSFPGYAFVKGFADNLRHTEEMAGSFVPVAVQFDDYAQLAFETHREPDGKVSVYLPGAPNPWSGTVVYVSSERVKPLAITLTDAIRNIRTLGKGPLDLPGHARAAEQAG
jgi:uncharacterized membrane protein